jgi:hypothetical protein
MTNQEDALSVPSNLRDRLHKLVLFVNPSVEMVRLRDVLAHLVELKLIFGDRQASAYRSLRLLVDPGRTHQSLRTLDLCDTRLWRAEDLMTILSHVFAQCANSFVVPPNKEMG